MVTEGSLLEGLEEGRRPGGHGAMGHPWAPIPSTQPSGQRVWRGTNTPVWRNTVERVAEIFQKGKHGSRYAINYMYVAMVNENDIQLVFKELPKAQRTEQRSLYS